MEKTNQKNKQVLCERCATDKNFTWPDEETRKQCLPIPPTFLQITQLKGIVLFTLDVLVFAMACTVTFVYIKNGSNLDMYINQSYALDVDSAAPRHIAYQFAQKRVKSLYLVQC